VLEATLALWPTLEEHLQTIVAAPTFMAADFPEPTDDERAAPSPNNDRQERLF